MGVTPEAGAARCGDRWAQPRHVREPAQPAAPSRLTPHPTCPVYGVKLTTSIVNSTPFSVSKQPCRRPAMHAGADIKSGRRTTNAAPARPWIARLTSTILRVGRRPC